MRRVVITGLGAVTPLGVGVRRSWNRILRGDSGIVSTIDHDNDPAYATIPSQVAGLVPRGSRDSGGWNADEWLERDDQRRMAQFTQYAMAAAEEAVQDSGCFPASAEERENMGVILGTGIGSFALTYDTSLTFHTHGHKKTPPLFIPRLLTNLAAGHLSTRYSLHGPNLAPSTACTTGLHALIQAHHLIAHSPPSTAPKLILAGASESCVHPLALSAFARARSLSTSFNATPGLASRPFDADRDGFVIAEGAAVLVLEEREHALNRGAQIYAEIGGGGMSGDAGHMTRPREDGYGAALAMRRALGESSDSVRSRGKAPGVRPRDVDYVNAHATGTEAGDAAELRAIAVALMGGGGFGDAGEGGYHADESGVNVSSTKGATGHLLGAAGALETVFTALAVKEDVMPPCVNLTDLARGEDRGFNFVGLRGREGKEKGEKRDGGGGKGEKKSVKVALTNSFGFGGTNASLCLLKHED